MSPTNDTWYRFRNNWLKPEAEKISRKKGWFTPIIPYSPLVRLYVKSNLFSNYYICRPYIISICFITDLCCSVKIQKITVPSVVVMDYNLNLSERPNLSAPEFLLDCDFDVNEQESGLVIKWFLNNQLVYQWIPPRLPTALSVLKNRIKKNYTVSDDPFKKYRGVAVTKPMLNFSGEYTCSVQTFQSSDKKSSFLQIIGKFNSLVWSIWLFTHISSNHVKSLLKCFRAKIDNSKIISN